MCFSSIKPILAWLSEDLEYVIVKGDKLYKKQNRLALSSCVDLPGIVDIENVKVTVTFLANMFGFLTENCQLELFDKITQTKQSFDSLFSVPSFLSVDGIPYF